MAKFAKKLNAAERKFDRVKRARENGQPVNPEWATTTDLHRPGDAWRNESMGREWKGARGKETKRRHAK